MKRGSTTTDHLLGQLATELSAKGYAPYAYAVDACPACGKDSDPALLVVLFADFGTVNMAFIAPMCKTCVDQLESGDRRPYRAALAAIKAELPSLRTTETVQA
jgi:hypothetical protein